MIGTFGQSESGVGSVRSSRFEKEEGTFASTVLGSEKARVKAMAPEEEEESDDGEGEN